MLCLHWCFFLYRQVGDYTDLYFLYMWKFILLWPKCSMPLHNMNKNI